MVPYVSCYSPLLFFCVCGQTGFSNQIKTGIVIFNEKWDKTKEIVRKKDTFQKTALHLPSEHWYLLTWTCFQNCKKWYNALWTGIRGDLVVKLSNFFISQLSSLKTTNRIQLFIRSLSYTNASISLPEAICHKPVLPGKWQLLQFCYKP